ncbi:putative CoA-substrate-specific enzyme activase [Natranaerovirga hydrolytica]|uniref:Putative CoA-substrate-specific enzyme activase n=1 Tax=Natranaerovirga hydrolytica TaxID=680378 RepID=A0A4R1MQK8_9FIRM|nr:acyl-CoA dehydratase activase [Natranaerovirga hydrolytica]TCK92819.1 putative CoA-substrate-specific enzyme activase [Natranaerovirga hydrolytica]
MKVLGIDLGSREVKIVLMEDHTIIQQQKMSTMNFYKNYCIYDKTLKVDIEKLGIKDYEKGISTGYGRNNTDLNTFKAINEIKAHVYGAKYQTQLEEFILLDIGGQDIKIMKVEKGVMTDLELNEKCAASCGRYLENMASVLEISVEELSHYYKEPITLNSTCAVFSESELIGKIAEGVSLEKLCAGVNYSLYQRLRPMLTKFKGNDLVISGGVAYNKGVLEYLKQDYNKIIQLKEPQYNGAIGCCYYGIKYA